ncbi:MAG: flagellar hook-associated protein FlgK [Planctomycetaceae bacterium]
MGLSATLFNAGRSLEIFSAGIQVAGNNVSNAGTPGYIREELVLKTAPPTPEGGLIFGTGALPDGIVQKIDKFLEVRLHNANSEAQFAEARTALYQVLESQLHELGEEDLSSGLSRFLATIQDVVNQPETPALRQIVIENGTRFAREIKSLRDRIDDVRIAQNVSIDALVSEANDLIGTISGLNRQITTQEAIAQNRSEAGALRTQRYNALNRLSEIVPIQFQERENGSVDVYTTENYLILGSSTQNLETFGVADRGINTLQVRLDKTKMDVATFTNGGELKALIQGRDQILGGFVDDLDQYAANVIREFNRIHTSGEGLAGYQSVTASESVADATAALNSTAAGLKFPPRNGSFQIKVTNTLTGVTDTTTIDVDLDGIGTDTSLNSLQAAINGVTNISATITPKGNLQLTAGANYEIRFGNDTSGALAGLGINTFFSGFDSTSIGVNPLLAANHKLLATGQGGGPSDSSNAVLLADFSRTSLTNLTGKSIEEFYEQTVAAIGQASASESAIADGLRAFQESLSSQREQYSGVSLDEETIKIMQFQHSYQAAARLIATVDDLLTTLLSI